MALASFLFIFTMLVSCWITRRCFRRPNPPPTSQHSKDYLLAINIAPNAREFIFLVLQMAHIALTIQDRISPSLLCPKPANLNAQYFAWTPYTCIALLVILTAGPFRISAFRHLGTDFTFELAKPKRLVTSGIYRYVQHPSYVGDYLVTMANFALFANPDGWIGCFLPDWIVEMCGTLKSPAWIALNMIYVVAMGTRVLQEEKMLHDTFGRAWESWHKKTARFIPGII
ncbi:hypothetical protein BT63DRAFT_69749 [Microthyrium microscopicum]|uniref:Protein-S-isoprenylcysteine O-methyltransferase n=1 Tax=Microthyrium microscopicum TaxID=703497 RepID=A0A6A6U2W1_9PEZI|nr:hypothetical protein BT63DRAFT_69749 [Microthyrium microscopicum]